ncbi:unnamed protein product [Cuscuta epithymum]|uniref:Nucleolus and neural progenitor protein-like N-terminal domain-containing protein n=2 Tax=Cuscuta epithymum TaxID=186058 RepID=A0AAV0CHS0_9ASTE|nr:unnamed protein product [Cuscuta epithymum]
MSKLDPAPSMASDFETVDQRLQSFLGQLLSEFGILDRIVYKNKNQHRRCSYFQYLLKVRRDIRLLKSANPEEIFRSSFDVINGKRPKQKVQLLESLKRKKSDSSNKQTFLDRLLGLARLLSQMVEPILKAATQVSTLLARSFFMGFSMTVLALLARIRVLVQQMLLDVVCVFNHISSLSQKKQSVKLNREGFEVFREYYPVKQHSTCLECVWEKDKYKLIERKHESEVEFPERVIKEDECIESPKVKYQRLEIFLGDDEPGNVMAVPNEVSVDGSPFMNPNSERNNVVEMSLGSEDVHSEKNFNDDSNLASLEKKINVSRESRLSVPLKLKSETKKGVAFVSVKKPAPLLPSANDPGRSSQEMLNGNCSIRDQEEEDQYFTLLTGGNKNTSLF